MNNTGVPTVLRKKIADMIREIRKHYKGHHVDIKREIVQDHDNHLGVYGSCYGDYASLADINQQIADLGLNPEDTFIRAVRHTDWDDNESATLCFFVERRQTDREYYKMVEEVYRECVPDAGFIQKRREYESLMELRHTMDFDTFEKHIAPVARKLYSEMYD